jgi:hypothetical protein
LASWDLVGTTLDSGANANPTKTDLSPLAGKHVVILPDNDGPGQKYTNNLKDALQSIAASIKVVTLPDLPHKGDIMDWSGDKAKLLALVDQTEENTLQGESEVHIRNNNPIPWPTLCREALPGIIGEFIDAACKHSEADPAAILATLISWFGIHCGTGPHLMIGDTRHNARVNAVIVGDTSKARKGTSAGPVRAIIKEITDVCRSSPGPLSSGEGVVYNVRDEILKFVVDKKTGAGKWEVSDPGIDDKRLFVLDEEFAAALQCTKREGNTLSAIIRTLFDNGDCEPLTKGNPIKATDAHVGITTHITIGELTKLLTATEQINGFGNRFLWVLAKRQKVVPFPEGVPQRTIYALARHIDGAVVDARTIGQYRLSDSAKGMWGGCYYDLSAPTQGRAGQMVSRGEVMVLRLALIYAIIAKHDAIESQDLVAAIALWNYCNESALYLFDGNETAPKLAEKIIKLLADRDMTRTEISNALHRNVISKVLDHVLDYLCGIGSITSTTFTTDGAKKPTTSFSFVPVRSYEFNEVNLRQDERQVTSSLNSLDSFGVVTEQMVEDIIANSKQKLPEFELDI